MFGPQAAYCSVLFGPSLRFGGFAFARELGPLIHWRPVPSDGLSLDPGGRQALGRGLVHQALALLTAFSVLIGPETHRSDLASDSGKIGT